ncbi:hypothetical protein [Rhodospirillum rubrum]|uniref:DUF945 domain-containing protein n=1 Tax=Rhodospirillum rubrum (strain ATCC 11170 / ATH 1.1.1 / DSM 467 / LMG 4362 / NCIMB 8255 / S1) TaxID=269796 RepID=Q2RNP4_RHORT|nr:hypothetical protein [Rhodospirillum rubrum]ABC24251.1 hypothetical protein Rru_A3457 [Rhodospirillum rubrum ATCC 11170]AEO50002.1 hypothetical protein F11_17710 [Rhodospirillum rubrum F11]MBK5955969.1 hypothetical protein [Rhodospirillum rubrum]QXG80183.1 hypothetical protein KUL73_17845 [Rhodospirillum rubrum]HCF16617.1 hypothetical protein [Rhodospirillum rubrum]
MKRMGVIAVSAALALGAVGAAGYYGIRSAGESKARQMIAAFQSSLPPGTTFEYRDLVVSPTGLSLTLSDVTFANPAEQMTASLASLALSNPGFSGTKVQTIDIGFSKLDLALTRPDATLTTTVRQASFDDVDIANSIAFAKRMKGAATLADIEPAAFSALDAGPVDLRDFSLSVPATGVNATLGKMTLEGITAGRMGKLAYEDYDLRTSDGMLHMGSLALDGLDLSRALRWAQQTQAQQARGEPPTFDVLGLRSIEAKGLALTSRERSVALDRFALADLESDRGMLVRATLAVEGFQVPAAQVAEPTRSFLEGQGLDRLAVDLAFAHRLDGATQSLSLGPLAINGGPLGKASASLSLTGLDAPMLLAAARRPEALLDSARLDGFSIASTAGPLTAAYADLLLAQQGLTRADLAAMVNAQGGQELGTILGPDLGGRLVGALTAFIENPKAFSLSVKAKQGPMNLTQLGMGLALVPQRVVAAYDITVGP